MPPKQDIQTILKERFTQLPKVVQNAITSADVQKHLREMANTQKLHIDQWESLEYEVLMTLFGVTPVDELEIHIKKNVGVSDEVAKELTENISKIVFEPIRKELERELADFEAGALAAKTPATKGVPVAPATPPQPPSTLRVDRAPISAAYKAGEPSTARASVEDDPYREPSA